MRQKIFTTLFSILFCVFFNAPGYCYPQFQTYTNASDCTSCHQDNYGHGFKTGVLAEFEDKGLAGLKDFVNANLQQAVIFNNTVTLPNTVSLPNTPPEIRPINSKWDVTVGEAPLIIPFTINDTEQNQVVLHGSAPTGASFSKVYIDKVTQLPTINFIWSPTPEQAKKQFALNVFAEEIDASPALRSSSIKTVIQVWAARNSATKNIKRFSLFSAEVINNTLKLSGNIQFQANLSNAQRSTLLKKLSMSVKTSKDKLISPSLKLTINAKGDWFKSISLAKTTPPCIVKLEYEYLKSARPVVFLTANYDKNNDNNEAEDDASENESDDDDDDDDDEVALLKQCRD
ncbi:MAG: hypothetical protein K9K84_05275 [Methylovulum sp.]|nr:hypothetical protein [Methylovulum sp.]